RTARTAIRLFPSRLPDARTVPRSFRCRLSDIRAVRRSSVLPLETHIANGTNRHEHGAGVTVGAGLELGAAEVLAVAAEHSFGRRGDQFGPAVARMPDRELSIF